MSRAASSRARKPDQVAVVLRCFYSAAEIHPAGAVIQVDAEEASRLIALGAADLAQPIQGGSDHAL